MEDSRLGDTEAETEALGKKRKMDTMETVGPLASDFDPDMIGGDLHWVKYNREATRVQAKLNASKNLEPCSCSWKPGDGVLPSRCRKQNKSSRSQPCFPPPWKLWTIGLMNTLKLTSHWTDREDAIFEPKVRDKHYWRDIRAKSGRSFGGA